MKDIVELQPVGGFTYIQPRVGKEIFGYLKTLLVYEGF